MLARSIAASGNIKCRAASGWGPRARVAVGAAPWRRGIPCGASDTLAAFFIHCRNCHGSPAASGAAQRARAALPCAPSRRAGHRGAALVAAPTAERVRAAHLKQRAQGGCQVCAGRPQRPPGPLRAELTCSDALPMEYALRPSATRTVARCSAACRRRRRRRYNGWRTNPRGMASSSPPQLGDSKL